VVIDSLTFRSTSSGILSPGNNTDCKIINSDLRADSGDSLFKSLGKSTRLVVGGRRGNPQPNKIHDTWADRCINLFGTEDCSISYNDYFNCHDSGHIDGFHKNLDVYANRGKQIQRMGGFEIQDQGIHAPGDAFDGVTVEGNCFYDWKLPNQLSYGSSTPPTWTKNVRVLRNYFNCFPSGQSKLSGPMGPSLEGGQASRFGYAIEIDGTAQHDANGNVLAGTSPLVDGNIIIGPYVAGIVSAVGASEGGAVYKNNRTYGAQAWGAFTTEGGNRGPGKWVDGGGNLANLPIEQAPTPEAFMAALGTGTITIPDNRPTAVTATAYRQMSDGAYAIDVTWTGGTAPFVIERFLTSGASDTSVANMIGTGASFTDRRFTDTQRNQTWVFYYKVNGVATAQAQIRPTVPTTQPTDPPPSGDYDIIPAPIKIRGGKPDLTPAAPTTRKAA
jgi:hypothetical protein